MIEVVRGRRSASFQARSVGPSIPFTSNRRQERKHLVMSDVDETSASVAALFHRDAVIAHGLKPSTLTLEVVVASMSLVDIQHD